MSTNTTGSGTTPSRGNTAGAGVGHSIRGAFQTVSGIGDSIRGNAMDFVDSALGTEKHHPESDIGRAKTEAGVNRMEAGGHAASHPNDTAVSSSAANPAPTTGTTADSTTMQPSTATSTAQPPLLNRNL
ncbi:hypothetical protein BD311DRAFT_769744 [Dichomitus squalens]|uniref:Uncharacterized protein n=1 Tax=Dichomitus squalens TaxID=114155 RepID=A0A4Q9M799_9APHY|nr:hypothetical protein BD311DRAFT_769744 [Dichomitus squalens]